MTRIALTGATGRVGSRLLPRLLARGYEVTALVRTGTVPGATVVNGDLNDDNALKELVHGADAVLHLAAGLRTDTDHEATNVGGTRKLVEAAREVPRFVHVSTNLVYPEGLGRPSTEDDPAEPPVQWGEYARTKALGEKATNGTIVRLAFVYGDGDPHLREALRWASTWPAHHRLHLIHHADVAQALFLALDAPHTGIYNAADDSPMTAAELHQINGVPLPAEPTQHPDPWHGIVSTNRIQRELGFRPRFPSAWSAYHAGAL
ncbi:NAD(P)-dependent oxidoreductase [Lentzea tibetensis]|uniref:NAD(P)-dependent oxidoreductase n=1 Tax=Lentzea tibetensis TaxID=2591470 RepID=A0A563EMA8_9PSEU|nr:NAD(P)-dependent oxidoreductase [Lentzea tibetensis]